MRRTPQLLSAFGLLFLVTLGCRTPQSYRREADDAASRVLRRQHRAAFGTDGGIAVYPAAEQLRRRLLLDQDLPVAFPGSHGTRFIDPIARLPDRGYLDVPPSGQDAPWLSRSDDRPLVISLDEALRIAARNSRDYQDAKEDVFIAALNLDLEQDAFRKSWSALLSSRVDTDLGGPATVTWANHEGELGLSRRFTGGALMTAQLGMNLVNLLTGDRDSSLGLFGDASISIPLMRGAGRFVVAEPMRQAERNVVYALYDFERFKRIFAVRVATEYLSVLEQRDRVRNAEENYRGVVASARRARRLADMGRLPEIQVDQAVQDELRARDRWVAAVQALERRQDAFRQLLGLPTDARVEPDSGELEALVRLIDELAAAHDIDAPREGVAADAPVELDYPDRTDGGPLEMAPEDALQIAFENRLDLRIAIGRIDDAQRGVAIAADALRADLTLLGNMTVGERRSLGSAGQSDAQLRLDEGRYGGILNLNLPLDRTRERNNYRINWIQLERAVRNAQRLEDQIKFDVRNTLRVLLEAREAVRIQIRAVEVARRRVRGTELFLEQGRAQIRDVLEARESLVSAENALTAAIVRYRVAELEFQRDLGVLQVDAGGLWTEFRPEQ